ncbi:MAG: transglycosylase family protein, partial [Actinomycetes bacterium]
PVDEIVLVGTKEAEPEEPADDSAPSVASGGVWDRLAQCESGGNWSINTGNGYYGGLQFTLSTWRANGGTGMPHEASRERQIAVGKRVQASQGWGAWPACTAKLGIR